MCQLMPGTVEVCVNDARSLQELPGSVPANRFSIHNMEESREAPMFMEDLLCARLRVQRECR